MKKILSLILVLVLSCMATVAAIAATDKDFTVEVNGYIGPDASIDIDDYVVADLTYPSSVNWIATNATVNAGGTYDVTSASYTIENNQSTIQGANTVTVDLEVTLVSFTETTFTGLTTTDLELNLTDDLLQGAIGQNLQAGYNGTTPYTAKLTAGSTWNFGFDGEYKHTALPGTAIEPVYDMVLNFKVDQIHVA